MAAPRGLTPRGGGAAPGFAEPAGAVAPASGPAAGSGRHRALTTGRTRTVATNFDARGRRTVRALMAAGAVCLLGGLTMLGPAPVSIAPSLDAPVGHPALPVPDPFSPAAPVVDGVLAQLVTGKAPTPPVRAGTPPVELVLPARDLHAPVVAVTTGPEGALVLPEPPSTVGWWSPSALAGGAAGPTVLAGHVDSLAGGLGALAVLRNVADGEEVVLRGADGRSVGYRVTTRRQYAKAELPPEVFAAGGPPRLVLITCGGAFDRRTRHYSDNVVVFADPV
ncbi:sortase domain-containing protein [Pseudonocardia hierapolitana]|uniref:sortase domain-containing protein n=1 Tax=Pseudonocardia hierapolitana TaxID=1128676 RepID=UPI0011BDAB03|nr:sortase [Pseudonocardia hierapolitana]